MLTPEIISALHLEQTQESACKDTPFRIFNWPEFGIAAAKLRECSIKGNRLAKKDQVLLTFDTGARNYRILLNNDRLAEQPESVRKMIRLITHQEMPAKISTPVMNESGLSMQ